MRRWNSGCFWGFLIDYWFFWVGSVVKKKRFLQSNVPPLSPAMRDSQTNPRKSEVQIDTVLQTLHTEERWIDFPLSPPPPPEKRLSKGNEYLMAKNMSSFFSRQTAWRELFIDSIPAGRMAPPPRIHMNSWYVCMTSKRKPFFCCPNDVQQKVGVQKWPCSIVYNFSPSLRFKVDGAAGLCRTYSHTWKKALIVIWPKILLRVIISSF